MELKSVMDSPEYRGLQDCPNVTSLAELKKRHDARAGSFGTPVSPPRDVPSLFAAYEIENRRHFAHQVERGLLRHNPQADAYEMTDKAFPPLGMFPYSTLAFLVSYFVRSAKQKRQLVLQS